MAVMVLAEGGDFTPISYCQVDRFLARHTRIKIKKSVLLESARKRSSTKEAYKEFYNLLNFYLESKAIRHTNIANMDKHSMQKGKTAAKTVISDSLTPKALI